MLRATRIEAKNTPIADCPAARQYVIDFMEQNRNVLHRVFDGDWTCIRSTNTLLNSLGFDSHRGNIAAPSSTGQSASQPAPPNSDFAFVPYRLLAYEEDAGMLRELVTELQQRFPCPYTQEEREELLKTAFVSHANATAAVSVNRPMDMEEHRAARQENSVFNEFEQMFPESVARMADVVCKETSAGGMQELSMEEQWETSAKIIKRLSRRPEGTINTVFYDETEETDDEDLAFADSDSMGGVIAKWCLVRKIHPITALRNIIDDPLVLLSVMMGCEQQDEERDREICHEDYYLSSNMDSYMDALLGILRYSGISYEHLVYELYRRHAWEIFCCYGKDASMHGYEGGIDSLCHTVLDINMPTPIIHQIRNELRGRGIRGYRMFQ